jgi:hypothetical protein
LQENKNENLQIKTKLDSELGKLNFSSLSDFESHIKNQFKNDRRLEKIKSNVANILGSAVNQIIPVI